MNEVSKYYRYFCYDPTGQLIREWTNDVVSEFDHLDEVNTFGSDLTIRLGKSIRNKEVELGYLQDETGANILDEDNQPIITEATATMNVGEGTDIDHNNLVAVYEYYGSVDTILDENGDPILDENDFPILSEQGALDGRRVFCGYIDSWKSVETDQGSEIEVTVPPLARDFANMIFENYTWTYTQNILGTQTGLDVTKQNGTDRYGVVQTFQAPASGPLLRIVTAYQFPSDAHLFGTYTINLKVWTGNDPNGARSLVYSTAMTQDRASFSGLTLGISHNVNDGPTLTSGSWYHLEVTTDVDRLSGGNAPFRLIQTDAVYTGSIWSVTGASTTYVENTSRDMYFVVDVLQTRETKVTYSSWDLYAFVDQTIDLVVARGGRVRANNAAIIDYVDNPSVTVPEMEFNVDTFKERLDTAVKAAPPGYYYRYDHNTNSIWFKARHETPDHTFVIGKHLQAIEVENDARDVANVVYFTGGPSPTDTDPPLFKRYADSDSVARYGVRAVSISDGRVKNEGSADIRAEYELAMYKDPVYRTEIVVIDGVYDTGTIFAGQTVSFNGAGTFQDDLVLQIMRKKTENGKVRLTLGALPRTERRRLDDLKQAVARMAVEDNEASPS